MAISDKQIQEIKNILEKDHGREFTWEEATQAMRDLENLASLVIEMANDDRRREEMLKKHPNGLHFEDSGCCCQICGNPASKENSWFDKYGLKCMICQEAINAKIIPGSIAE